MASSALRRGDIARVISALSRDKADMTRAISPLRKADDAQVLDNSHMSVEEQMEWFMERYAEAIR